MNSNFVMGLCLGLFVGSGITYFLAVKYTSRKINEVTDRAQRKLEKTKEDMYKSVDAFYEDWRKRR